MVEHECQYIITLVLLGLSVCGSLCVSFLFPRIYVDRIAIDTSHILVLFDIIEI